MIKGIDGQVMIHRITDFARESSAVVRRDDVAQSQFASTFQEQVEEKQTQVEDTNKSEQQNAVNRDGHNAAQQESKKRKQKDDQEPESDMFDERNLEVAQPINAVGRKLDIMA